MILSMHLYVLNDTNLIMVEMCNQWEDNEDWSSWLFFITNNCAISEHC
jgi:hypothetical protein